MAGTQTGSSVHRSTGSSPTLSDELFSAARDGQLDVIKQKCDSAGVRDCLKMTNSDGQTLLHVAVSNDQPDTVGFLVETLRNNGLADVINSTYSHTLVAGYNVKWTALHLAVHLGHINCIRKLAGADATIADRREFLPLHIAAESKKTDLLKEVLETFSDSAEKQLNETNNCGMTPLMCCAVLGHVEGAEMLLKKGARITTRVPEPNAVRRSIFDSYTGQNVLHMIVQKKVEDPDNADTFARLYQLIAEQVQSTDLLESVTTVGKCSFKPWFENIDLTVVELASALGETDLLPKMLALLTSSSAASTGVLLKALHAATNYGHSTSLSKILDALLSAKLDHVVNDETDFRVSHHHSMKWTALHIAVHRGHLECMERLKLAGANPVKKDKRSFMPIHVAAESSNRDVLRVFLKLFCRINENQQLNAFNMFGMTPLMCCAVMGNTKGVELLLEYGADATLCVPPAIDSYAGQNLLHLIVQKSVEEPSLLENFIEIFETVRKLHSDDDDEKLNRDLLLTSGNCSFSSRFSNKQMDVVQFAASIGAIDLLDVIVNSLPADVTPDHDPSCKEYSPEVLQQLIPLDGEHKSCLELVSLHCTIDETAKITRITPITEFVARFSVMRSLVFIFLLAIHATYMGLFTYTVRSNHIQVLSNQSSSVVDSNLQTWLIVFFVWPLALLFYEFVCLVQILACRPWCQTLKQQFSKFIISIWWYRGRSRRANATAVAAAEKSRYNIVNMDVLSHVTTVGFALLMLSWCCAAGVNIDNARWFVDDVSVGLSAIALIWGWMQTLEYVRFPQKLHAFVVIVKLIFIKDVFYILCIYVFIMIGFASAVYIYLLTPSDLSAAAAASAAGNGDESGMAITDCIYHIYATMLGDGALFDAVKDTDGSAIRIVFSVYLCLSIIVLLNMLIAMMNNRYANVIDIKETLWFIETLNSVAWICSLMPCVRDCLFQRMSRGIAKHQCVSADDDQVRQLNCRISAMESSLNELRQKLEQQTEPNKITKAAASHA